MFGLPGKPPPPAKVGLVAKTLATPLPGVEPRFVPRISPVSVPDCPERVAALSQVGAPDCAVNVIVEPPGDATMLNVLTLSLVSARELPIKLNCAPASVRFFDAPPRRAMTFVVLLSRVKAPL